MTFRLVPQNSFWPIGKFWRYVEWVKIRKVNRVMPFAFNLCIGMGALLLASFQMYCNMWFDRMTWTCEKQIQRKTARKGTLKKREQTIMRKLIHCRPSEIVPQAPVTDFSWRSAHTFVKLVGSIDHSSFIQVKMSFIKMWSKHLQKDKAVPRKSIT